MNFRFEFVLLLYRGKMETLFWMVQVKV